MNQRTFLGLTHNPFEAPRSGFFPGADRKNHLEQMRQLSGWSRRILAVTGPLGIGKTSLFKELSSNLEPGVAGARISGTIVTREREVVGALLQGFGIDVDLNAHVEEQCDAIIAHVNIDQGRQFACVAMVDDAQLLEPQALVRLVQLVAASSMRVVLFGETSVATQLDDLARAADVAWFEIRLTGFPKTDVRDYLEWRFEQAQYRGRLPFTDEQLDTIADRSSGNPGAVDAMAHSILTEMESGDFRKRTGFPITHVTLVAVLLVAFGLAYLYFSDEGVVSQDVVESLALPEPQSNLPISNEGSDGEVGDQVSEQVNEQLDPLDAELTVNDSNLVAQGQLPDSSADDTLAQPIDDALEAGVAEIEAGLPEPQIATPTIAVVESEPSVPEPEPIEAEEMQQEVQQEVQETVPPKPEPVVVPKPKPAPKPVKKPPVVAVEERTVFKSGDWLLAQNPARFTLQLVTLSSLSRAETLIRRQADLEEFAIYRLPRDGRTLYVVTYGVFSTRDAASGAAQAFRGELAQFKAWVRPMYLVQDAIENSR